MKPWPVKAELDILTDACVPGRHPHSYWNFVRFAQGWIYKCRVPPDKGGIPWLTEREHKKFCDWFQGKIEAWDAERRSGIVRRHYVMLWVFRGFGKTNCGTKPLIPYCMLNAPNITSVIGSETHVKAQKFLAPIKNIVKGEDDLALFPYMFGNWFDPEKTWTRTDIDMAVKTAGGLTEPSIGTYGIETGVTGYHPLILNLDDPLTEEKLKDGENAIFAANRSVDSVKYALRNDGLFVFEGTCYRDNDVIQTLLALQGVASWTGHSPLRQYPSGRWHVYFLQARDVRNTANYPKGEPVLPEAGLDNDTLEEMERTDPIGYPAQMMGDPGRSEANVITHEQIQQLIIPRSSLPPIGSVSIHLDTAFKTVDRIGTGDDNVITSVLHPIDDSGMLFVDKILASNTWRSEDFDLHLVNLLHHYASRHMWIRVITDEAEMGGKATIYLRHLQDIIAAAGLRIPYILQISRGGKKKPVRIRTSAIYWLEGLARLVSDCGHIPAFTDQLVRGIVAPHDDIADALADMWHPEVWHGRAARSGGDYQPPPPSQPGDDVIKGRIMQELLDTEYEIKHGRPRRFDNDYQPADHPDLYQ